MLLRALVVLALVLGGSASAGAVVDDHALDPTGHAGAHSPGHGTDHAAGHDLPDAQSGSGASECCGEAGCDCGCAAPKAPTLPVVMAPAAWDHGRATFTRSGTSHSPGVLSAPFRPPA